MALESAYTLTVLLAHHPTRKLLPSLFAAYTKMRLSRTLCARQRSKQMHDTCQLVDGFEQQERDRVLKEEEPGEKFPNPWADPGFQNWMWSFDAISAAEECWEVWEATEFQDLLEK